MHSEAATTTSIPFELASLSRALNYQRWVYDLVEPFLGQRILEVGAGIGNMSRWLLGRERVILTELDSDLLRILEEDVRGRAADSTRVSILRKDVLHDDLSDLEAEQLDTVVSFNVLEHIENDRGAFERLVKLLRQSPAKGPKRLVTFVPAHSWAFGEMDRTFGHFRRYDVNQLRELARGMPGVRIEHMELFNLLGLLGWFVQGRVFKTQQISMNSIRTFEAICPWVRPIDRFLHRFLRVPFGQSILFVCRVD